MKTIDLVSELVLRYADSLHGDGHHRTVDEFLGDVREEAASLPKKDMAFLKDRLTDVACVFGINNGAKADARTT